MPAMGQMKLSHGERLLARRRMLGPVPVFGPVVFIVNVTEVAPAPAAIEDVFEGDIKDTTAIG